MSNQIPSYEAFRIMYQSSESAARAAYQLYTNAVKESQTHKNAMISVVLSLVEVGEAAGVRGEDQLNGSLEILFAINKIKERRDRWKRKAELLEERMGIATRANKTMEPVSQVGDEFSEAERIVQSMIDDSPEPIKKLGEFLTTQLDEDRWPVAEALLLKIAQLLQAQHPSAPVGEAVAVTARDWLLTMAACYQCALHEVGDSYLAAYPSWTERAETILLLSQNFHLGKRHLPIHPSPIDEGLVKRLRKSLYMLIMNFPIVPTTTRDEEIINEAIDAIGDTDDLSESTESIAIREVK